MNEIKSLPNLRKKDTIGKKGSIGLLTLSPVNKEKKKPKKNTRNIQNIQEIRQLERHNHTLSLPHIASVPSMKSFVSKGKRKKSNERSAKDIYKYYLDKDDNEVTLQEVLENSDRNIEDIVDLKLKIKLLYDKMRKILKSREKLIIELRFGLNGDKPKTQKEIAKMMNISRSYVSRIESKAIGKLAKEIKE